MRKTDLLRILVKLSRQWAALPRSFRFAAWLLGTATFSVICNMLSEGRGPVILLGIAVVCIIAGAIHWGDRYAKSRKVRGLFWFWGVQCFVFSLVFLIGKLTVIHEFKEQMRETNAVCSNLYSENLILSNELIATNTYYLKLIADTNLFYENLRDSNNALKSNLEFEVEDKATILSLNYRANYYAYLAKAFLTNGQFELSVKHFERCDEAERESHTPQAESQFRVLRPLYLTAQYMTNWTDKASESNYLDQMYSTISQYCVANNGPEMLAKMDGQFALVIQQIIPPSQTNVINILQADLEELRRYSHAPK